MRKTLLKLAAAAALIVSTTAGSALAVTNPPAAKVAKDQFFSWFVNDTDRYISSPFLTDQSASGVNAWLKSRPAGTIRAVKVYTPISNATANLIFNNPSYNVSYVLGDFEDVNVVSNVKRIADQVRYINGNNPGGGKTYSHNAFIGNFGFTPLNNEVTTPPHYVKNNKNNHSFSGWGKGDYNSTKLNMAMPELYPGSASFKSPAAGNSSAPNIRSALFTLPALRVSQIKVEMPKGHQLVPYITNFNNWLVPALDTDRNAANGYKFIPGQAIPARNGLPALTAAQTTNQMLSRRDFAAQVAHYRMRGIDSFVQFDQGVIGRSNEENRRDAKTGWLEPNISAIFAASDYKLLIGKDSDYKNANNAKDPNGNIIVDGKEKSVESAGSIFSGVYSLTLKKMEVLLSNLDDKDHDLTLPSLIAGFALKTRTFDVDAGQHLLVEYRLTNSGPSKGWSVWQQSTPFLSLPNDRSQIGVPEPTSTWLAAAAAMWGLSRRRNRDRKSANSPEAPVTRPMGLCGGNMPSDVFVAV